MNNSDILSASAQVFLKRDPFVDGLRGIFHIILLVDHLPFLLPGLFTLIVPLFELVGYVTVAEGFVFLSGFITGLVYTRIRREKGDTEMWWRLLIRARNIYLCYVASVLLLLVVVRTVGVYRLSWGTWEPLINEPFMVAALKVATLLHQPTFLEILPMYSLFLLVAPIFILQLERGRYAAVLLFSVFAWVVAQTDLRSMVSLWLSGHGVRFGFFHSNAWQILFLVGLVCGHKTFATNGPWLPRGWGFPLAAAVVAFVLFLFRHGFVGQGFDDNWISRSSVAPIRLLNFFCIALLVCRSRDWIAGWIARDAFAFLSKHSLPVFAFHLLPIYLIALAVPDVRIPIWAEVLVVAFCIISLYKIAFLAQATRDLWRRIGFRAEAVPVIKAR